MKNYNSIPDNKLAEMLRKEELIIVRYFFKSEDENGVTQPGWKKIEKDNILDACMMPYNAIRTLDEMLISFLRQTDDAYLDENNFVREIYEGNDQKFCYTMAIEKQMWEKIQKMNFEEVMNIQ